MILVLDTGFLRKGLGGRRKEGTRREQQGESAAEKNSSRVHLFPLTDSRQHKYRLHGHCPHTPHAGGLRILLGLARPVASSQKSPPFVGTHLQS